MKKPTLPLLALAALAAGCTPGDYATNASSPWADGGADGGPNPIVRSITTDDDDAPDPNVARRSKPFSFEKTKQASPSTAAQKPVALPAPEDADQLRITGARDALGLFSFVTLGKLQPKQLINVNDTKNAAWLRIVEVDEKTSEVVAELRTGQERVLTIEVGSVYRFSVESENPVAAAAPDGAVAIPADAIPAEAVPPAELAPAVVVGDAPSSGAAPVVEEPPAPTVEEPPALPPPPAE
jgi:hypothetical protein